MVEDRLSVIEQRLLRIEARLGMTTARPAAPPPARAAIAPEFSRREQPVPEEKPGNWLGIIAVVCFVLAAGFIIKLSIDSGWLTPLRQVSLAAMLGMALVGAGFALVESDIEYASLLPGAGIIVLYLSVFAAHRYYELLSFGQAIAATVMVSGLCIWLYTRIRHDVYPVTAVVGAYAAPIVLGMNADAAFSLFYFILCSLAFAMLAIWVRSRLPLIVAAYLAIAMTGWIGLDLQRDALVAGLLAAQFLIFALSNWQYALRVHLPMSENEAWGFLPVLMLFYPLQYHFIDVL